MINLMLFFCGYIDFLSSIILNENHAFWLHIVTTEIDCDLIFSKTEKDFKISKIKILTFHLCNGKISSSRVLINYYTKIKFF